MSDLTALCSESALRTIMALEDTAEADNGFEAWRLLARRAQGGRGLRTMGLLQAIMDFDFRGPNYLDRLMVWKGLVREYEKRLPGDEILADDIKRASVQKKAPPALKAQLLARVDTLTTWSAMDRFIEEYYHSQRVFQGGSTHASPPTHGSAGQQHPTPMDIDALHGKGKGGRKGKDDKGKGKGGSHAGKGGHHPGKGGGKDGGKKGQGKGKANTEAFMGYCRYCAKWGHRAAECRTNPANAQSGRPASSTTASQHAAQEAASPAPQPATTGVRSLGALMAPPTSSSKAVPYRARASRIGCLDYSLRRR